MAWFARWLRRRGTQDTADLLPRSIEPVARRGVSEEALGWAKGGRKSVVAINHFAHAKPLPGTLPAGAMAMDEAAGISQWASGQALDIYGSLAELHWPGYSVLALLAQKPEHRAIVGTLAREMTREWIKFEATGDGKEDRVKELEAEFTRLNVRDRVRQMIEIDGFQGRGHL